MGDFHGDEHWIEADHAQAEREHQSFLANDPEERARAYSRQHFPALDVEFVCECCGKAVGGEPGEQPHGRIVCGACLVTKMLEAA